MKAENIKIKSENVRLRSAFEDVYKENQEHRVKYNELKAKTKKLNDKLGALKQTDPEREQFETKIAMLEAEKKALAEKCTNIYTKNEKLSLDLHVQSKKIETFEAIEKLILDTKKLRSDFKLLFSDFY